MSDKVRAACVQMTSGVEIAANIEQSTALIEETPTGPTGVPHLWIDGTFDATSLFMFYEEHFAAAKLVGSPLLFDLEYDEDENRAQILLHVLEGLPPIGDYRLRVAVTEDNVYAPGPNGEVYHQQAFRYLYPDLAGQVVEPVLGTQEFWVDLDLDPSWQYEELRLTVYVQDLISMDVLNAATMFLAGDVVPVPMDTPQLGTGLTGVFPNPFNPTTTVQYTLHLPGQVSLQIYDLNGRLVRTLVSDFESAGQHSVVWNGLTDGSRPAASGVYFARLVANGTADSRKLVLTK